jgi:hypothetical protein
MLPLIALPRWRRFSPEERINMGRRMRRGVGA